MPNGDNYKKKHLAETPAENRPIENMVPAAVEAIIRQRGLYGSQ